jgi:hypothetical protein
VAQTREPTRVVELDPGITGSRFLTRGERAALIAAREAEASGGSRVAGGRDGAATAESAGSLEEQARALFGKDGAASGREVSARTKADASAWAGWTIVLATIRPGQLGSEGEEANAKAEEIARSLAEQAQSRAGLSDVGAMQRGGAWLVTTGTYEGPGDAKAQTDLRRIKGLELDGVRAFEGAMLLPPERRVEGGTLPEFDLSTARERFGARAEYTLQVAIYRRMDGQGATAEDLAGFREAAESAVMALRQDGQEAFYYHGPRGSTVTVGLFGEDDYATQERDALGRMRQLPAPRESPALLAARAAHPYNLVNGEGVRVRSGGREAALQASILIKVPR